MDKKSKKKDLMKEFKLEPTLRERICKRMFPLIYRFYRPRKGNLRIQVNRPFKVVNPGGMLSRYDYRYSMGRTNSLTEIGLFEGCAEEGWFRRSDDDRFVHEGRHCNIIYLY